MNKQLHDMMTFTDPSDQVALLRGLASASLIKYEYSIPMVCAHRNNEPIFIALLRPYEDGEHTKALEEILPLAETLGANRLAFCTSGKAWPQHSDNMKSLNKVDSRKEVILISTADGSTFEKQIEGTTSHIWTLDECVNGTKATVFKNGKGEIHELLKNSVRITSVTCEDTLDDWDDEGILYDAAELLLELEENGHYIVGLGPAIEHRLGIWIDRIKRRVA